MADACNAVQRNLYPKRDGTRFIKDYRNGDGRAYGDYMRQVSWPIPTDVPPIGQASAPLLIPELKEVHNFRDGQHYLHPTKYGKLRHTDHLSFSKTMGNLGVGMLADPKKSVYDRLYIGSKSTASLGLRTPQQRLEMAADIAFKSGDATDAIPLYTKALAQQVRAHVRHTHRFIFISSLYSPPLSLCVPSTVRSPTCSSTRSAAARSPRRAATERP